MVGVALSGPAITDHNRARSSAQRAIGPTVSSVGDKGTTPVVLQRPAVGRRPSTWLNAAGMRIEPLVSLPMAAAAKLAATATALPPLEPPGTRAAS
ncbi:hypothetical protein D3C72_2314290 [compost metagenome]